MWLSKVTSPAGDTFGDSSLLQLLMVKLCDITAAV